MTDYILGGGIAGLIYAFYNKSFIVVSPEFGGQMNNHFPCGPRFLHDNEYSRKFMQDLNLTVKITNIKTGYQLNRTEVIDAPLSNSYIEKYYLKSRGLNSTAGMDDTVMSEGKTNFDAIEVDFNNVIALLTETLKDRLKIGKVIDVNAHSKEILLETGELLSYNKLVNAMPLSIFASVLKDEGINFPNPEEFKSSPVTYIWLKPEEFKGFNYIYVPQPYFKHHRLTFDNKGLIAEWFGFHNKEECLKVYKEKFIDCHILWNAQIIPYKKKLPELQDIKLIGRYGTWDRKWKTEKVIEEAIKDGQ